MSCSGHSRLLLALSSRSFRVFTSINKSFSTKVGGEGWLGSLVHRREYEPQSQLLSDSACIYELQIYHVKPQFMVEYLSDFELFLQLLAKVNSKAEILGCWTCEIGQQDAVYHLWKYPTGYQCLTEHGDICMGNKDITNYQHKRNTMLFSRRNQICLPFSFWPLPTPRPDGKHLYELRSYALKPGTMIEWGNHWARALRLRSKHLEPVAGMFSHIGEMHMVHHFWAYDTLESRRKSRDSAWQEPGWNTCVMRTVPLIRYMTSSILLPTSFSPMQ